MPELLISGKWDRDFIASGRPGPFFMPVRPNGYGTGVLTDSGLVNRTSKRLLLDITADRIAKRDVQFTKMEAD